MSPFSIIYADPAWRYGDKLQHSATKRGAAANYPTMSVAEICALDVRGIAAKDSICFLWATAALMAEAMRVMKAWGFDYRTIAFVWVKKTKTGKNAFGMGRWTRSNVEYCLLGVRGKMRRIHNGIRQIVELQAGRHSEKPAEVRERIVALMGDLPRVELFARKLTPGWVCMGNEIDGKSLDTAITDHISNL